MTPRKSGLKRSLRTNFTPGWRDRAGRVRLRARQAAHLPALLAGGRVVQPIFIIGAPRSGTSLLYSILRTSPQLAHWPGEAHEVWEADYHPRLRGWASNVLQARDVTGKSAEHIRRSFFLVTGAHHRLIEKSPRNSMRVSFVEALFPDASFIYLKRDGRDNVNSLINAWRTPRYRTYRLPQPHALAGVDPAWWKFVLYPGWEQDTKGPLEVVCARQWMASNELALSGLGSIDGDRVTTVAYEALVADPVREVGRVMRWLGLDYEEQVRARAAATRITPINVVTPPERGKWRRENPRQIHAVLPLMKPMMEELGYELDED